VQAEGDKQRGGDTCAPQQEFLHFCVLQIRKTELTSKFPWDEPQDGENLCEES
jgi:hypothetical protein